jgi:hypothetical protein
VESLIEDRALKCWDPITGGNTMEIFKRGKNHLLWAFAGVVIAAAFAYMPAEAADFKANVFNRNGGAVGMVDAGGTVFNQNGRIVGRVDSAGKVFNSHGGRLGTVDPGGDLFNRNGGIIGKVEAGGKAFNRNGGFVGKIEKIGSITLIGGAAIVLLL